jgi:sec-independent protein translocase protein TatC
MFNFLLGGGDNAELDGRVKAAESSEQEVVRYVRIGDLPHAVELAHESSDALAVRGDAQVEPRDDAGPEHAAEVSDRIMALGRMVDAVHDGFPPDTAPLKAVMEKRLAALKAYQTGRTDKASGLIDEAAELLFGKEGPSSQALLSVWHFEKHVALARGRYLAAAWTKPMLSMSEQLTLVLVLELAVGVIFELPLVMALLSFLGVVKAKWLMKYQRHAFIVCLILAAIITPTGDPVNLSLMAGPMILCYELGVLAAWIIEKRRGKTANAIVPTGRS